MDNYPLLILGKPKITKKTKLKGRPVSSFFKKPDLKKQAERLEPVFASLENALNKHKLHSQISTLGLEPECTVVMEIRGDIGNFISITKNTPGLEWLAEIDTEAEPDNDFYYTDDNGEKIDKNIKSKLFVTMAEQKAINELMSCWKLYVKNPNVKFKKGQNGLKKIFEHLYTIRRWDVEDRIENSYLIENWELKKQEGHKKYPLEIELWFRNDPEKRKKAQSIIENEIIKLGGEIIKNTIISEIKYHAILANVPVDVIGEIKNKEQIELLKCEEIMYLNPTPQTIDLSTITNDNIEIIRTTENRNTNIDQNCIIAVLDGVPISNHVRLKNFLNVNDVDDIQQSTASNEMSHGTAICSLIVNGDLLKQESTLRHRVYVRPIMDGQGIPQNTLPVDITYRAIHEIITDDELKDTIKIINLSVGDRYRPFNKNISAWAKLIDYFSYKYNILFCISAGNYEDPIDINCTLDEWNKLSLDEKNKHTYTAIRNTEVYRKIISPSESINAVTVGAIYDDNSNFKGDNNRIELIHSSILPSPISRQGLGVNNSIKPDICVEGGRTLYTKPLLSNQKLQNLQISPFYKKAPGLCVAYGYNEQAFFSGTSLSCALTTRAAGKFYEILENLYISMPQNIAVLIKAMLVHSASWGNCSKYLGKIFQFNSWQQKRRFISKHIGYGKADFSKLLNCNPQKVIALSVDKLQKGFAHEYSFPLPISLTGKVIKYRLSLTLAWFSPLNFEKSKYRKAKLWIDIDKDDIFKTITSESQKDMDIDSSLRGTVQHVVYENNTKALAYGNDTDLVIKVNCAEDDLKKSDIINYGLVVSLEVYENNDVKIYNEVATRIKLKDKVRTKV